MADKPKKGKYRWTVKGERSGLNFPLQRIPAYYMQKINETDKAWYLERIAAILELALDDLPSFLVVESLTPCEFDTILGALESSKWITALPKKDSKNPQRAKEQFEKAQNKLAEMCKTYKLYYKKLDFGSVEFYEDLLKQNKNILYDSLRVDCKTGIVRAQHLIKILEEL